MGRCSASDSLSRCPISIFCVSSGSLTAMFKQSHALGRRGTRRASRAKVVSQMTPTGDSHETPRILILSASVGAGHLRAAEAVEAALRQIAPHATVTNLDVLEMTNRVFRRFYA